MWACWGFWSWDFLTRGSSCSAFWYSNFTSSNCEKLGGLATILLIVGDPWILWAILSTLLYWWGRWVVHHLFFVYYLPLLKSATRFSPNWVITIIFPIWLSYIS
jgi:hypothetical protein